MKSRTGYSFILPAGTAAAAGIPPDFELQQGLATACSRLQRQLQQDVPRLLGSSRGVAAGQLPTASLASDTLAAIQQAVGACPCGVAMHVQGELVRVIQWFLIGNNIEIFRLLI